MNINEFIVEDVALIWFGEMGNAISHEPYLVRAQDCELLWLR